MGAPVNDQLGPSQDAQSAPTLRFNQGRTNNAFEHFLWKILRLQCFNDALLVDGDHCAIGCFDKFVVAILKFAPSLRSKSAVHLVSLGAIQSFGLFCLSRRTTCSITALGICRLSRRGSRVSVAPLCRKKTGQAWPVASHATAS